MTEQHVSRKFIESLMGQIQEANDQVEHLSRETTFLAGDTAGPIRHTVLLEQAKLRVCILMATLDLYWEGHGRS